MLNVATAAFAALLLSAYAVRAEDDAAALAKALPDAAVSLQQGLMASEREGNPISGKFELDDGALQLSVYTAKGDKFTEVIVDHKTGAIKKAETITDSDDLKDAKEQNDAMQKAALSLSAATAKAVAANAGYVAVKVVPTMKERHPIADVTLMKGTDVRNVEQRLD
ncbi:MAG TPA: hypothetical protein VFW75_08185 [Acetobacteraceae bacterium]|nr:hypothetical protein [Acetobacteraceae bacterium]